MNHKSSSSRLLTYTFMVIYTVVVSMPMVWMVFGSLKDLREMFNAPFRFPTDPQWGNYAVAWDQGTAGFMLNSIFVTTVSVIIIVFVSGIAAYALARLEFAGREWIYLLLIAGYAIPVHTVLVPLYQSLGSLNLLNTYPGLIGPYVAFAIPFSVLLLYGFFIDFPADLEEAGRLDGCNAWQILWYIVLPLSRPGLATVAIFQGVFVWNEFLLALLIISDNQLKTLPLGLSTFQGQWSSNFPVMLAALTIATIPMLILYVMLQRQFVNSLVGFSKE